MWRICPTCGIRTDALSCDTDACPTEVIRADTEFPGRLHRGDVLLDHYVVHDLVGVGGMGAVYRGQQRETLQSVAIKVLWRDLAADPIEVKRFTREARAASLLAHPNAVRVIDFGSDSRTKALFIIMEFLVGQKLSDVLRREPIMEPVRVVHIVAQVCKALEEAHRKGVVHRDVKPDNIFLQDVAGERDFAKLLDFGLAKFIRADSSEGQLTRSGFVVGSPEYMAPEQASGSPVGPAADLYSLGIVLYECLSGRLPFDASTTAEVLRMHILKGAPALIGPPGTDTIPPALEEVVMRCLEKDPAQRPPTADALRIELLKACDRRKMNVQVRPVGETIVVAPGSLEESGRSLQAPGSTAAAEDPRSTVPLGGSRASIDPASGPTSPHIEVATVNSEELAAKFDRFDSEITPTDGLMAVSPMGFEPPTVRESLLRPVAESVVAPLAPLAPDTGRESSPLAEALDVDRRDPLAQSPRAEPPPPAPPVKSRSPWPLVVAVTVAFALALSLLWLSKP
ncbi:MAG: serine/threonine protein kinase [Deltaproteobacteria bacterium]|nr:serine/threonine protein kinase [Deltaproteobacteria bacterium]